MTLSVLLGLCTLPLRKGETDEVQVEEIRRGFDMKAESQRGRGAGVRESRRDIIRGNVGKKEAKDEREKGTQGENLIWVSNSNDVLTTLPSVYVLSSGAHCWVTNLVPSGAFPPFSFFVQVSQAVAA